MKRSNLVLIGQVAAGAVAAGLAYALRPKPESRFTPGDVVVVTGGSRGLGYGIAERYAQKGARLVLASRNARELDAARARLLASGSVARKDDVLLVSADLTDQAQAAGLIKAAERTFGRVDILVNNAGIITVGPFEDQPLDAYEQAMATNYFAALYTTLAALPAMMSRGTGAVVNIASIGGKIAVPHMLPYSASKFAMVGFSEGLHAELRHKGIRITTVCPGLMRTGGEDHAHFIGQVEKEKRWFRLSAKTPGIAASVEHAAKVIVEAVDAQRAEITITPQAWLIARAAGVAPEATQWAASVANRYLLPDPLGTGDKQPDSLGAQ